MKHTGWETVSSERHFANAHLEVVTDHVQTPSRSQPRTWTIVHRKAAVIIAPMTRDGKIVLIRQERIPIRQSIWEMPSGQIDSVAGGADLRYPSETIEQVALRELSEEAGYELAKDGELIALGYYFSSPGFTDERGYFFLARPSPHDRGERNSRRQYLGHLRDAVSARSSVARAALILLSNGAARHLQISRSAGE